MSLVKITKSNHLVEASYSLTLQEQRLVLSCLAKIDSRQEAPKELTLSAQEYSESMGVGTKNAYRELKKAADKLYSRNIVLKNEEKVEEFRWIQRKLTYTKGAAKITLVWSDEVLRYISQLKRRFTTYRLVDVARLNTSYAIRLYELLMQFNSTKQRSISVKDFRSYFQLTEKYSLFRDLNKRVIKPALNEINTHSNLDVNCYTEKKGKTIVALIFDFQEKKQPQFAFDD
jgi:plasmid replication initiation protein